MPQAVLPAAGQTQTWLNIPPEVEAKYPDLVELIKVTESMNLEEKNYWLKLIPIMNGEQIANLRSILIEEREKINTINQRYDQNLQKINDQYQTEMETLKRREKKQQIKSAEQQTEKNEQQEEENLLSELAKI